MKNTRKKVLPLLLAGILLLSAGAYGTRAYFTDSAEQEAGINLSLGTLDIESSNLQNWFYTPEFSAPKNKYDINDNLTVNGAPLSIVFDADVDSYELGSAITVGNVRPGDAFTREITFTNSGTLTQKISLDSEIVDGEISGIYDISLVDANTRDAGMVILKKDESVVYTIKIAINGDEVDNATLEDLSTTALTYMEKTLRVTAEQPNAPVTP